jgi:hypothetical protein
MTAAAPERSKAHCGGGFHGGTHPTSPRHAGFVPGIHCFFLVCKDVDGRDKPGHDGFGRRHFGCSFNAAELMQ